MNGTRNCEVVAVGGSAGALGPLIQIAAQLPEDFPAAVLVVLHTSAAAPGLLPEIVGRSTSLEVGHAVDREPIEPGRIYLAPPDRHLLLAGDGRLEVTQGPRENRSRPAIDPLFRTVGKRLGRRAVGVLLSGLLNDGTYGLAVMKAHGAVTIAQDPEDAEWPEMPASALRRVAVDHVLPAGGIAGLLGRVIGERERQAGPTQQEHGEHDMQQDPLDRLPLVTLRQPPEGESSPFMCPECGGTLWETHEAGVNYYRCHVGHAYSDEVLLSAHSDVVENALWGALRALEEKAELARRLAERARASGHAASARQQEESVVEAEQQASAIYSVLVPDRSREPRPGRRGAALRESEV